MALTKAQIDEINRRRAKKAQEDLLKKVNTNRLNENLKPMTGTTSVAGSVIPQNTTNITTNKYGFQQKISKDGTVENLGNIINPKPEIGKPTAELDKPLKASDIEITKPETETGETPVVEQVKKIGGIDYVSVDGGKTWQLLGKEQAGIPEAPKKYADMTPFEQAMYLDERKDKRLDEDILTVQEQIKLNKENIKQQKIEQALQTRSNMGATQAGFSESRLGATTSSAQVAKAQGIGAIGRGVDAFQRQLQGNLIDISVKERELVRAREDKDIETANVIISEIAKIQQENQEIQAQIEEQAQLDKKYALDVTKQATDYVSSTLTAFGSEALANMTDNNLINFVSSTAGTYGLDDAQTASLLGQTTAMRALAGSQLALKKDDPDYQMKQAQIEKLNLEIANYGKVDPTKEQQNFQFYGELLDKDTQLAEKFAQMTGISERPLSAIETQLKQADLAYKNAQTQSEKYKYQKQIETLQGYQAMDSKYLDTLYSVRDGQIGLDGTRGQCGEFVNDVLGMPSFFQNEFTQKVSKINSYTPTVGSVFVSSLGGDYGHVGFVKEVLDDGRLVVTDSNRYNNEKTNTRTIDPTNEQIVGYFNPVLNAQQNAGKATNLTQIINELGGTSKVSDKEAERIEEVIKENPNLSARQVADRIKGFEITKESDKSFAENLRNYALGIEGTNLSDIAKAINDGDRLRAINIIESNALSGIDKSYKNEQAVNLVVNEANRALKLLQKVPSGMIGQFDGNVFPIKKGLFASDEEVRNAQQLQSVLTGLVAKMRNELSGTAVTESEAKFLEPLIASLADQPATMVDKLKELKNTTIARYNASRESVGARLPAITEYEITNPKSKVYLYTPKETPAPTPILNSLRQEINTPEEETFTWE